MSDDVINRGYRLVHTYFLKQLAESVDPDTLEGDEWEERRPTSFTWDWRLLKPVAEEANLGIAIRIKFEHEPTSARPERIEADMVGRFDVFGDDPKPSLDKFVQYSGPTILVAYLRERVSSLTSHGIQGRYDFPIVNMVNLMGRFSFDDTTGAQQLGEKNAEESERSATEAPGPAEEQED